MWYKERESLINFCVAIFNLFREINFHAFHFKVPFTIASQYASFLLSFFLNIFFPTWAFSRVNLTCLNLERLKYVVKVVRAKHIWLVLLLINWCKEILRSCIALLISVRTAYPSQAIHSWWWVTLLVPHYFSVTIKHLWMQSTLDLVAIRVMPIRAKAITNYLLLFKQMSTYFELLNCFLFIDCDSTRT